MLYEDKNGNLLLPDLVEELSDWEILELEIRRIQHPEIG